LVLESNSIVVFWETYAEIGKKMKEENVKAESDKPA
jgi:hypothetical protein